MAIAEMTKLLLVGNNREKDRLMHKLHRLGCAEITVAPSYGQTEHVSDERAADELTQKIAQIEFLFDALKSHRTAAQKISDDKNTDLQYRPAKDGGMFCPKPSLTFDELVRSPQVEIEVFAQIAKAKSCVDELTRIKADRTRLVAERDQLAPFAQMPIALERLRDTRTTAVRAGSIAASKAERLVALDAYGAIWDVFAGSPTCAAVVIADKEKIDDVLSALSELEFTPLPAGAEGVAADRIAACEREIARLDRRRDELVCTLMLTEYALPAARRLHDYYTIELRKLECARMTASTRSSYILEAWVPTAARDRLDRELDESGLTLAYAMRDPLEDEIPPTCCVNNGVVTPYESVTNMFSAPDYREIDPNPFVTFFFFLFFGMMVSDAGYGLLLTLGAGIVLWRTKPPKGQSNLIKIIFMGGISTLLWGMVFGSYFGFSAQDLGVPYWFNPIEDPMMMLYLSLGMGLFQMCFGLGINMVALIRKRKPLAGICGAFSWYLIILGLAGGAVGGKLASWLPTVGWALFGVGLVLLMLAGALGKKGAKKVTGALGSLYGIINFFSDLMSYTRIFGLGLATAVIGMVFNQIGQVLFQLIPLHALGAVAYAVIFLIGHVFNVGINTLGAYVHNSRLQFVEFFGKFYTGGGRLFRPLGSEMKYYYIKPQEGTQQ